MSEIKEPVTVGLSAKAHSKLKALKEEGFFAEMSDAYCFATAYALASGQSSVVPNRQTFINVGSLDPNRVLYDAVKMFRDKDDEAVYRSAERYAEWGVLRLAEQADRGHIEFTEIFNQVQALLGDDADDDE